MNVCTIVHGHLPKHCRNIKTTITSHMVLSVTLKITDVPQCLVIRVIEGGAVFVLYTSCLSVITEVAKPTSLLVCFNMLVF